MRKIVLFQAEQSLMTFEGVQLQGAAKIMEKIQSLTFQKIAHLITAVDCQPSFDGGVLINVLGQLKERKMTYSHIDKSFVKMENHIINYEEDSKSCKIVFLTG